MSLCEQFRTDLTQAMKSGDKVRLSTLRLLTAAIKNRQIDKGGALDDAEALEAVRLATKQRREAIALGGAGTRYPGSVPARAAQYR